MYVYVYTHVNIYVHIYTYIHICTYVYTYICIYIHTCTCIYVNIYICTYITYTCIHIYIYIYIQHLPPNISDTCTYKSDWMCEFLDLNMKIYKWQVFIQISMYVDLTHIHACKYIAYPHIQIFFSPIMWQVLIQYTCMGWLWLVGSIKLQVSFAKEPY